MFFLRHSVIEFESKKSSISSWMMTEVMRIVTFSETHFVLYHIVTVSFTIL